MHEGNPYNREGDKSISGKMDTIENILRFVITSLVGFLEIYLLFVLYLAPFGFWWLVLLGAIIMIGIGLTGLVKNTKVKQ